MDIKIVGRMFKYPVPREELCNCVRMLARIWADTENARDFVASYSSYLIVVPWNYGIITIVDFVTTT